MGSQVDLSIEWRNSLRVYEIRGPRKILGPKGNEIIEGRDIT
jgi:hypothetical protein